MFNYIWPIALVVISNTVYQICAKSLPGEVDPFASLTVTYLVAALCSAMAFLLSGKGGSFVNELGKMNWSSFLLGIVIVGLEVGFVFAYKAGWQVSTASIVQSSFLAIALLGVGLLLYHEPITRNKLFGLVICMVGLVFINKQ